MNAELTIKFVQCVHHRDNGNRWRYDLLTFIFAFLPTNLNFYQYAGCTALISVGWFTKNAIRTELERQTTIRRGKDLLGTDLISSFKTHRQNILNVEVKFIFFAPHWTHHFHHRYNHKF